MRKDRGLLSTGETIEALASIVEEAGAKLVGIGAVIEKSFEGGREQLAPWGSHRGPDHRGEDGRVLK